MTQAYTPGLRVSRRALHRCRRRLPQAGTVRVALGDVVSADAVVAQTELPGAVLPVNVVRLLGIAASDVPDALVDKTPGRRFRAGDLLAESRGIFGWFRKRCVSPADGVFESASAVTGQVILRGPQRFVELRAYLAGTVVETIPGEGATIEAEATHVQGIFGVGGEAYGPILVGARAPDETLSERSVESSWRGSVVVGGAQIDARTLFAARDCGAAAVVTGGIDDQDLRDFLGFDLGVATTGSERTGLTVIVTEGFGAIAMARRTYEILASRTGAASACTGATQIRAGVLRPEIVVPWTDGSTAAAGSGHSPVLAVGAAVRIVRDPVFGTIGVVAALPSEPVVLESGSKARVVDVRTPAGDVLRVPRANVELIAD